MRKFFRWLALSTIVLVPWVGAAQTSNAAVCTTTLSGAQSFTTLTIPAGEVYCLDPAADTTVSMGGNLIVEGTLEAKPSSASVTHTIRFTSANEGQYVGGGMNPVATDDGLWVMGAGKLDLQGTPKVAWNRTGDDPSWSASDELVVAPTAAGDYGTGGFPSFTKGDPVPTAGPFPAEVLNLTRNVRIEGMPPQFESPVTGENNDPGRAHILIRSTVPQTIKHIAIRYMGPRQAVASDQSDSVLGRYGLHFHHNADGSRGSLVEGVVVRDAGAHSFVPHASHGITFRDTIAYDVMENAYWWDPMWGNVPNPNETHDVLYDRAVAAHVWTCSRCSGRFTLTGFALEEGIGNTVRDSVAVGIQASKDSSGFQWPESANQGNNVWAFEDNVAHNNVANGVFTWQNDFNSHIVTRYTGYRNGHAGIDHGAYSNRYVFESPTLWRNGDMAVEMHAIATGEPVLSVNNATIDASTGHALRFPKQATSASSPSQMHNWNITALGTAKAVQIDNASDSGTKTQESDFTCWTLPGGAELEQSDFLVSSIVAGSVFRVQQRDGDAYQLTSSGFSTIAAFATCGEPPPPTTTTTTAPPPTTTTTTAPPPTTTTTTPPSCAAEDSFTRSETDGWGTANVGGSWSIGAGPAADFDVNGSAGTIATPTTAERRGHLDSTSLLNAEVSFQVKVPGGAFGSASDRGLFVYSLLRRQSGGAYARLGLFIAGSSTSNSVFIRGQDQAGTNLFTDVDTGLTHSAGDTYSVKVQATGSAPTTYRAKVWKVGATEPGTWMVDTTSTLGPTSAGAPGVRVIRTDGVAQTLQFDDFKACEL